NCIVQHPSSPQDSGRLVFCTSGGLVTDCHIGDNRAFAAQGAGVYLVGSELRNSTISGMVAAGPSYFTGAVEGAGIYAVSSTISGCTVTGSGAQRTGGGAYLERCEVDRCIISGNTAGFGFGPAGQGGGIFAVDSVIRNSVITANRASPGAAVNNGDVPGFGGGV